MLSLKVRKKAAGLKLDFDFDIHARRHVQTHQHVNRLGIRVKNINQAIVRAYLEMLMRIFINKRRAAYCKPFYLGWQGHRPNNMGAGTFGSLDDPLGGLVENTMILSLKADTDLLFGHHLIAYSRILVTTPAPTVRPPSRMANLEPCSRPTGTISSTVRFTLSPGITISTPSGRVMSPVTSIVRM